MKHPHCRNRFEWFDSDEAAGILEDAARALAERGWTTKRLVAHLGLSHEAAQKIVDEVGAEPPTKASPVRPG